MRLIPYEPLRYFDNWRRDLDRFFTDLPGLFPQDLSTPRIDVYETDREVVASCELPGLEREDDVRVEVEDNVLRISGSISRIREVKEDQMHRRERFTGRFQRSVALPTRVSAEGCTASYKNGILEVRMPKAEPENKRRVDINFH